MKKLLKTAERTYYQDRITNSANSLQEKYKVINEILGDKDIGIISPKTVDIGKDGITNVVTDEKKIADAFNDLFIDVGGNKSSNTGFNPEGGFVNENSIFLLPTDHREIIGIIDDLSNSKAVGKDYLSNFLLKKIKHKIASCLVHITNLSMEQGCFPDLLKDVTVKIKFKGGNENDLKNYRPISIVPAIGKVIEKVIAKRMINFLKHYNCFGKNQAGFIPGKSTDEALGRVSDFIRKGLDDHYIIGGVAIDLSKAFDSVNHDILLKKLNNIGIRGVAFDFCKSYLKDRVQSVNIKGIESNRNLIKRGVPQGSILGPLFFVIFLNDLDREYKDSEIIMLSLFADDSLILIKSKELNSIIRKLNISVSSMCNWFRSHDLSVNANKSSFIIFTTGYAGRKLTNDISKAYVDIDGKKIAASHTIKYLGIIFDSCFTWKEQINLLLGKLSRFIHVFYRLRVIFNISTLLQCYFMYIQARIQYGILVYTSTHKTKLEPIFRMQRKILRIIFGKAYRDPSIYNLLLEHKILSVFQLNIVRFVKLYLDGKIGKNVSLNCNIVVRNNFERFNLRRNFNVFEVGNCHSKYGEGIIINRLAAIGNILNSNNLNIMNLRSWKLDKSKIKDKILELDLEMIKTCLF